MSKKILILLLSLFISNNVFSSEIVVSIKPLHSLVSSVAGDSNSVSLLIEGSMSPHNFALKPSHAKLLNNAKKPTDFNEPKHKVESLMNIWKGNELNKVRKKHFDGKVNDIDVCKECTFKDTYSWEKVQ